MYNPVARNAAKHQHKPNATTLNAASIALASLDVASPDAAVPILGFEVDAYTCSTHCNKLCIDGLLA